MIKKNLLVLLVAVIALSLGKYEAVAAIATAAFIVNYKTIKRLVRR